MFRQDDDDPENKTIKNVEYYTKILEAVKSTQSRYVFVPENQLNEVLVGGIRDLTLGKYGRNVLRVCNPALGENSKSTFPRLCIDSKGFPGPNNPHIPIPPWFVSTFPYIQSCLEKAGIILSIASIAMSGYRVYKVVNDEGDVVPELAVISAEWIGSAIGGWSGAKVGGSVGVAVAGPLGGLIGVIGLGCLWSKYGLDYGKQVAEKFIKAEDKKSYCFSQGNIDNKYIGKKQLKSKL